MTGTIVIFNKVVIIFTKRGKYTRQNNGVICLKEILMKHDVTVFQPYQFKVGQKIRIENSRRKGDWEVADIGEHKITLRCPISKKEFEWTKFCYLVEEEKGVDWPQKS
jgi:hypothetical protein